MNRPLIFPARRHILAYPTAMQHFTPTPQGILLAAGLGHRFDPLGRRDKLLQPLADGRPLLWHSAHHLCAALPGSVAIVRPQQRERRRVLEEAGCTVLLSASAEEGMGRALALAVAATAGAGGWVVALGDMPWLAPELIRAVAQALDGPEAVAAPYFQGQRGHPVAFGAAWGGQLAQLCGDHGARALLQRAHIRRVACASADILRDVDLPADLDGG